MAKAWEQVAPSDHRPTGSLASYNAAAQARFAGVEFDRELRRGLTAEEVACGCGDAECAAQQARLVDRATAWARRVADGEIVMSDLVVAECRRHLADLDDPRWRWDAARAEQLIEFVDEAGKAGTPGWRTYGWMCFWVGRLFGMLHALGERAGLRRFQTAFLITGRGSGKSAVTGAVGLWGLLHDGVFDPLVWVAARDKKQADTCFRDALKSIEGAAGVDFRWDAQRIGGIANAWQIRSHEQNGGAMEKISGLSKSAIGRRPTMVILDEYAQHVDASMYDAVVTGYKGVTEPLTIITTNAGEDLESPCGGQYSAAKKVAAGEMEDESLFPFVAEINEEADDPMDDEGCWVKANPTLPDLPGMDVIRKDIARAKSNPSFKDSMLRLRFGVWIAGSEAWIPQRYWKEAQVSKEEFDTRADERREWRCYLGLDLSESRDLTAAAAVWVDPDSGDLWAQVWTWTPADTIVDRNAANNPLVAWRKSGDVIPVPGTVIHPDWVASWLCEMRADWRVVGCAFDAAMMSRVKHELEHRFHEPWSAVPGEGLWLVEHKQSPGFYRNPESRERKAGRYYFAMPRSIDFTEEVVMGRKKGMPRLRVRQSGPVISAAGGVRIKRDGSSGGNRAFSKKDSITKTDAVVALTQAVGMARQVESWVRSGPSAADFAELESLYGGDGEEGVEGGELSYEEQVEALFAG